MGEGVADGRWSPPTSYRGCQGRARPELFYGPGAEDYTDYPFLEAA
ncbi:hypothetical protein ACPCVO_48700 [Streptomyces umbrinus]